MENQTFVPSTQVLQKYAEVLVNFSLNAGKGLYPGEKVLIEIPANAEQLLHALTIAITKAEGYVMYRMLPSTYGHHWQYAHTDQIAYRANADVAYFDEADHRIRIFEADPEMSIPSDILKKRQPANRLYWDVLRERITQGLTYVVAMWPTQLAAERVGMTLKEYWDELIKACWLDIADPVSQWQANFTQIERIKAYLDNLDIQHLEFKGEDIDLKVVIGEQRKWLGGTGRNMPSCETFTSPDWRGTQGWVRFNQPLYYHGKLITDIELNFAQEQISYNASQNVDVLRDMIYSTKGMNRVGEISMTHKTLSRITRTMGEVLFDENMGGEYGNMHLALGNAYPEAYTGNKDIDLSLIGFNKSVGHQDIVLTRPFQTYATCRNGERVLIYENGLYTFDTP